MRRAVLAAVLAAALLGGCSATNPITTDANYDASDGTSAVIGDVEVGNLLVLTTAQDAAGTIVGFVTNRSATDAELAVELAGGVEPATVAVPAGSTVLLGPDHTALAVAATPAPPGANAQVTLRSNAGSVTLPVPVLDGTLPEYADLLP